MCYVYAQVAQGTHYAKRINECVCVLNTRHMNVLCGWLPQIVYENRSFTMKPFCFPVIIFTVHRNLRQQFVCAFAKRHCSRKRFANELEHIHKNQFESIFMFWVNFWSANSEKRVAAGCVVQPLGQATHFFFFVSFLSFFLSLERKMK